VDKVDEALEEYRRRHGIAAPWETRERVVVALAGTPGNEHLIRRAARIAQRRHGELIGVHVQTDDGLVGSPVGQLEEHRKLLGELGGQFREITGTDIARALVEFAHTENATQIVLGASTRSRWQELTKGSVINRVIRLSGPSTCTSSPKTTPARPARCSCLGSVGDGSPPCHRTARPMASPWSYSVCRSSPLRSSTCVQGLAAQRAADLSHHRPGRRQRRQGGARGGGGAGRLLAGELLLHAPLYRFTITDSENLLARSCSWSPQA
jgi:nucleotide-binding universal stress UspA family protein